MSEPDLGPDDLDLQRRLDAAFSQTRPRRGFEDELWARVDPGLRPRLWNYGGLLSRLPRGAWPALGAVAAVLVLAIVALPFLTHGQQSGGVSSSAAGTSAPGVRAEQSGAQTRSAAAGASTAFGPLPKPRLSSPDPSTSQSGPVIPYYGPASLTLAASVTGLPRTLPVFRFTKLDAGQQAALARTYDGQPVAPSSNAYREPRMQITASSASPSGGAPPDDATALRVADTFLAGRKLAPTWSYLREVLDLGPLALVRYVRRFDISGYGSVNQVDQLGAHAGAEVAVGSDGTVLQVTMPVRLDLESAAFQARAAKQAAQDALTIAPPTSAGLAPEPRVRLTQARLVYIAVEDGVYGYFEPAVLFTGAFSVGGTRYEKRVIVPALAASQLR